MFHQLLIVWFNFVEHWGYVGVFVLMALESSIVPVPSEIVMPPAAYWAAQGRLSFWGVVLAGTFGSFFGSAVSYWVSQWVGTPVLKRYGKFVLLSESKLEMAENWVHRFGVVGIFLARLLPVVRHLISIPAGILKMNFPKFTLSTTLGAFSWCLVLSWFGAQVIGDRPDLLSSPDVLVMVLKEKLHWFAGAVVAFGCTYGLVIYFKKKLQIVATVAK